MSANSNIKTFKLMDNWFIAYDKENDGIERGWDRFMPYNATETKVPSIIAEALPDCHGVAFYFCKFTPKITVKDSGRLLLKFGAADYKASVYLNGEFLGSHEGGETPFTFDVTDNIRLGGENFLSVRIVNPVIEDIDGLNIVNVPNRNKATINMAGSCTNYGGLCGEVELISLPAIYIDDLFLIGDINEKTLKVKVCINNTIEKDIPLQLSVNVYGTIGAKEKVCGGKISIRPENGVSEAEITLNIPDMRLWDIDDPYLYSVEVSVRSEFGRHRKIENFGFREFLVKDGYFYLNGRKIFLKSSHTGNAFPVGQGYPAIKEQIRKDMVMAKAYGFNMVRSIAGMLREEQLRVCDEIGLMVYEENFAGWDLGFGFFLPEAGRDKIGDVELMLKRFDYCTIEMIKRDRNHPSITIWGLLNEMNDQFPVTKRAKEILPTLREYDPTRLVLFNSGRWDKYEDVASGSNPYSSEWDAAMGNDLHPINDENKLGDNVGFDNCGDLHIYPTYPFTDAYKNYLRNYAKDYLPAFFSESGMSGLLNVIEEAKHYEQHGFREDLEDYKWIKSQADKLECDWQRLNLKNIFPYPEMMLKESQRMSAFDRRRIFDIVRSNPKFNGYSITGLLDHGWCGEGLWSLWRRFKPEVYDTVCDGWAPLRFCLFTDTHVMRNREFEVEAVLANENVLKEGKYKAYFAVVSDFGTVKAWEKDFEITDDAFAIPVMKEKITLDVPGGKYSLIAYMDGASPLGNKLDFFVSDEKDIKLEADEISYIGIENGTKNYLESLGAELKKFEKSDKGVVIIGKEVSESEFDELIEAVENGAKLLFMDYRIFEKEGYLKRLELADDIIMKKSWDWLYHKESVNAKPEIFKGLGFGLADQRIFGQVISMRGFETRKTPDEVISPAFYTGYHGYNGSYGLFYNALGFKKGEGTAYLNSFDIELNLDKEPAAKILLVNYLNYLK